MVRRQRLCSSELRASRAAIPSPQPCHESTRSIEHGRSGSGRLSSPKGEPTTGGSSGLSPVGRGDVRIHFTSSASTTCAPCTRAENSLSTRGSTAWRGSTIAFIHPSSAHGVLIELKQSAILNKSAINNQQSAIARFTLGDLELISLCDGFLRLDGGLVFAKT